jgi:hypothetical protein
MNIVLIISALIVTFTVYFNVAFGYDQFSHNIKTHIKLVGYKQIPHTLLQSCCD